jgi:hypothetical protein
MRISDNKLNKIPKTMVHQICYTSNNTLNTTHTSPLTVKIFLIQIRNQANNKHYIGTRLKQTCTRIKTKLYFTTSLPR